MTPKTTLVATLAALVLVGAGAYFMFVRTPTYETPDTNNATTTPSTNTTPNAQENPTLELSTPDYNKPIAFAANVSPEMRAQLDEALKTARAAIDKNKLNVQAWVDLGSVHKIGGDYKSAALYWEFVTSIYSGTGAPFMGLGDLYQNFLHDYAKAEKNYLAAIQVNLNNIDAYANLYTMYHYTLKDDAKARAILEQGLVANPNNTYLLGLKAELN